jgi:hypothetical protein
MLASLPELSLAAKNLKPGRYRHYKGENYEVLGVGRNEAALEEVAIYRSVKNGELWTRPLIDFLATVHRDGYNGPRFIFIK